jgi:hypothetical protein
MIKHALDWAGRGLPVFPLQPKSKIPFGGTHGCKDATRDDAAIREWWQRWPQANIGVATGDGFFVVDLDGPEAQQWFVDSGGRHGAADPTLTVKTARGWHLYFWAPCEIPNSTSLLGPHVDVRGTGGYVVGSPSVHPSGNIYKTVRDLAIAEAPRWLTDLAIPDEKPFEAPQADIPAACQSDFNPKYVRAAVESELDAVANSGEGGRNVALLCAAIKLGTLSAAGAIAKPAAEAALFAAAAKSGLPAFEIRKTLASGFRYGEKHPRSAPQMNKGGRHGSSL